MIEIMRRIFLTIVVLLFSWNVFSQGIQFETGSWKEVLQKAKQENKLIFVDLYTTWCGPCIQESPAFAALSEKYKDKDIDEVKLYNLRKRYLTGLARERYDLYKSNF